MPYKSAKRNIILSGAWFLIALVLIGISLHYRSATDAIVAQVDPQRIAVSFQRAVRIKNILVIPGQDVMKGDSLLEVERPDLIFDIERADNKLEGLFIDRKRVTEEFNNQILSIEIERQSKIFDLDQEIKLLQNRITSNQKILLNLPALELEEKLTGDSSLSNNEIRLKTLSEEKIHTEKSYMLKLQKIDQEKGTEINLLNNSIMIQEKELSLLYAEKNDLVKFAPINGTIGNVFAQIDELVSPFTTIISIYEANPTIIKAYVNERRRQTIIIGDKVLVESSNRKYSIIGKVFEVGSRITDYPQRLAENRLDLFGQEIFISIPENNKFLGGEKVYVRLIKGN